MQDHLNKLRAIDKEVMAFRPNIEELERYNEEVQEAMIFENRHTPYTMEVSSSMEHISRALMEWAKITNDIPLGKC